MDAEDLITHCGFSLPSRTLGYRTTALPSSEQVELSYFIDLTALFRCASGLNLFESPFPTTAVNVEGVHWANEVFGPGAALWTSVHGMQVLSGFSDLSTTGSLPLETTATSGTAGEDGPGAAAVRRAFEAGTCNGEECGRLVTPELRHRVRALPEVIRVPLRELPDLLGTARDRGAPPALRPKE